MSTKGSASDLGQAVKDLWNQWQLTKLTWRDAKSIEFEQKYLESLPSLLSQSSSIMDEIDLTLRKIRRDCE